MAGRNVKQTLNYCHSETQTTDDNGNVQNPAKKRIRGGGFTSAVKSYVLMRQFRCQSPQRRGKDHLYESSEAHSSLKEHRDMGPAEENILMGATN